MTNLISVYRHCNVADGVKNILNSFFSLVVQYSSAIQRFHTRIIFQTIKEGTVPRISNALFQISKYMVYRQQLRSEASRSFVRFNVRNETGVMVNPVS